MASFTCYSTSTLATPHLALRPLNRDQKTNIGKDVPKRGGISGLRHPP